MGKITLVLLLSLLPILGFSQDWAFTANSGGNIVLQGTQLTTGANFNIGAYKHFNKVENNFFSTALSTHIGYFSWYDLNGFIRRANTVGVSFLVGDEDRFFVGPFIEYAWQFKSTIAGAELHATLVENFILRNLSIEIGGRAGMSNQTKSSFIAPRLGIKYKLYGKERKSKRASETNLY